MIERHAPPAPLAWMPTTSPTWIDEADRGAEGGMMAGRRMQRLNDQIRDEIAHLLSHDMNDPHLRGVISITGVETAPDLSTCRVFVSVLGDVDEAGSTLKRVQKASGYFRRELAVRLNLRRTPDLDFRLDRSIAEGAKIEQLLREIIHD